MPIKYIPRQSGFLDIVVQLSGHSILFRITETQLLCDEHINDIAECDPIPWGPGDWRDAADFDVLGTLSALNAEMIEWLRGKDVWNLSGGAQPYSLTTVPLTLALVETIQAYMRGD